ncbi:helix-turn-helix transcriptional regulator [Kaistia adipata]|uniref:helix-turn-helix transcriptional regulator n=1 Tax=Kaistia adipata TaxID=166954 RepID=UPI00146BB461|nr:helix-turn-helix transcriptional regulator [Kaistia adipata]
MLFTARFPLGLLGKMRIDFAKLDQALDRALEAAVDHSLWPSVLQGLANVTGSFGANIIPASKRAPGLVIATESMNRPLEDYFNDGWHENEWRLRAIPFLLRQGTACDQQYTSRDDFERQAYYRFQAKHGIGRTCMVNFSTPEDMLVLTLHRRLEHDFFADDEIAIFRAMRDRLMTSSIIMRSASKQRASGMAEAFEMTDVAAIFFDRFGKVTMMNDLASRLLGRDLQVTDRQLRSRRHSETANINKQMQSILSEHWLRPDRSSGPIFVARDGARPLVVRIQRLGGSLPDFFSHSVGVCLVEDPEATPRSEPGILRQVFGLTPAETDIVIMLGKGQSLRNIAEAKSITYETVRTHLRSIFSKTETSRQAELVALMGRVATKSWLRS